jgi:N-acetylglucosamine-6-phosphate deacetylase
MAAFRVLSTPHRVLMIFVPFSTNVPHSAERTMMGDHATLTIAAPCIFDGNSMRGAGLVHIRNGRIAGITLGELEKIASGKSAAPATIRLPADVILAPGFIDVQVNGGGGVLLNDEPTEAGVRRIVEAHRAFGTTGCLPTLMTDRTEVIEQLAMVAQASLNIPGVLGFHLEGPALNTARKGIHPASEIRVPNDRDLAAIKSFGGRGRSLVTLAPECVPAAMIDDLISSGLRIAAGHSDATSTEAAQAADRGVTGVTHLFNAMSQLGAREPGLVGATLDDGRLFAGIICDGVHVDASSLRIALRCKGRDRLMLVTDAMPLVGTSETQFALLGKQIKLREHRLSDPDGTLAGAHLTMIEAVRNAVAMLHVPLADTLIMASRTPAAFLGLESELGQIAFGYRADLVAFNQDFEVVGTWVAGIGAVRETSEVLP